MNTIKLYPYSTGDESVGISSWNTEIIINHDFELEKEDIEWFKHKVKEMFESWDCDGVYTEKELEEGIAREEQ